MGISVDLFDDFDRAFAKLCAAFNVPCTNERRSAYRQAFGKIHLAGWERLIEYCLSEEGPEKFPTVKQLWILRKEMRHSAPAAREPEKAWDPWLVRANLALLSHIRTELAAAPLLWGEPGAARQEQITSVLVKWKNQWVAMMQAGAVDGRVDANDQRETWANCMRLAKQEFANA